MYLQKKISPTYNSVANKIILQKWKRNKDFLDKQKLREFVANRHAFQEWLKEIV